MKKLICYAVMLTFILTKIGVPGQQRTFIDNNGKETINLAEAKVFDTIKEAYTFQNTLDGQWEIETVS